MKSSKKPIIYALIVLLLWGAGSWFIAKNAKQQLDMTLASLAEGRAKDFFEVEVLDSQESLYGATTTLKLIPTSAIIDEEVESWKFLLERFNGPVFVSQEGVTLGIARWQLSVQKDDLNDEEVEKTLLEELFPSPQPIASLVLDFFENANVNYQASEFSLSHWQVDKISIKGNIDLTDPEHTLLVTASGVQYRNKGLALNLPNVELESKQLAKTDLVDLPSGSLTVLTAEAEGGELIFSEQSKKTPFDLQSRGSIWLNNDTLSSDWQIDTVSGKPLALSDASDSRKLGYFQATTNLQIREFLASGFWQYLNNQSEIYSLLQQAEWAVEEVETPEQQDFLRSLYLDADRIERTHRDNPLKPMLIAKRSQLAANVKLKTGNDQLTSQLSLGGKATGITNQPRLLLNGEIKIKRDILNRRWTALLDKWNNRRWFRRYETEFESDITVRNERLLLNKIIVSADGLAAELSQTLTDQ